MDDPKSEQQRILRRHQREKKELQAQIQSLKNSVPKTDKKKRKQLLQDVARMEAEMAQKHRQELEKFQDDRSVESVVEDLAKMDLENRPPRPSKAQRKRERMESQERARQESIFQAEMSEHLAGFRREEEEKLADILGARGLEMKEIPADGHCMYRAIQDQLVFSVSVEMLRCRTASYMQKHVDEFLPFFSNPETGDPLGYDDFMIYCDNIVRTAAWGGQLELRALSHVLKTPIEVIQANSPTLVIGEEYVKKPIILVYLHYAYSLGEHYNSVRPLEAGAAGGALPRLR
ncbi:OTU domain-containing protein 6A [Theropithecus gelada]|uniref:ubiquitinyl hydrolase 1 n=1 Tax=Theropithecus gelada TaxID=9565 RepID=A0A8D2ES67_THEGE|nr:OTU domain-containing protein 6A [Theropithecus gelada]